mgnify:CR=1 FL=1
MEEQGTLRWKFDVSAFRLIGRDLITDRITALFELVKNCYDANAQHVTIEFANVGTEDYETNGQIVISDDGYGMSFEDIRDKWMVIGTSSKRLQKYSPAPYNRRCVGEKGVGRFAVDKLGDQVSIMTKKAGTDHWVRVDINWGDYFYSMVSANAESPKFFTEIDNPFRMIPTDDTDVSGTRLIIRKIRECWKKGDVDHLAREISHLVSPFANLTMPFKVRVNAPEFSIDKDAISTIDDMNIATCSFSIGFDRKSNLQESVYYDEKNDRFGTRKVAMKRFGGVKMKVYFFDASARKKYHTQYPNDPIAGFKVYRDGVIATPFAETNEDPDKKRDVLGIDKRLWRDMFSRVSTREFIGIIEITNEGNPQIIDATNRQDFVDNNEYRDLKEFIILQLDAIQQYKVAVRNAQRTAAQHGLHAASDDISELISSVSKLADDNPQLKPSLTPVIDHAKKSKKKVQTAIAEQAKESDEFARKESIFNSIMSLQQYAIHITHAVRTTLNQIRDDVEFFYDYYPDPEEDELFKYYAKEMYERFIILNKVIDYMLSYSQSNLELEDVDLNQTLDEILSYYRDIFSKNDIVLETSFPEPIILKNSHRQFFRDILQNLIDNSIKAVSNSVKKTIRCSFVVQDKDLILLVSDTGYGIPYERRNQVFALYYTTTAEQGGAGVGLYIAKTRVESLKGTIEVVDSEFGEVGTTFKIVIPFNKK